MIKLFIQRVDSNSGGIYDSKQFFLYDLTMWKQSFPYFRGVNWNEPWTMCLTTNSALIVLGFNTRLIGTAWAVCLSLGCYYVFIEAFINAIIHRLRFGCAKEGLLTSTCFVPASLVCCSQPWGLWITLD